MTVDKLKWIVKYWLPPVLWGTVIFSFSSLPTIHTTTFFLGDFILKKTAHLMEYGIFATLFYRALVASKVDSKKALWLSVLAAFLYGVSDEFHQSFTPGREPTLRDVLIDTTGASIFIFGIIGNIKKMPSLVQEIYKKYLI